MTVEDDQTMLDHQRDLGRSMVTAVAVQRRGGPVAAYTDLVLPSSDPTSSSSGAASCSSSPAGTGSVGGDGGRGIR